MKFKPGTIIGQKKLICVYRQLGKIGYWRVRCLKCNTEEILSTYSLKTGAECTKCHRKRVKFLVSNYFRKY